MTPKEHPLIFSAEMIRAILEGRKSVTRRLADYSKWKKGNRVWVREAFAIVPWTAYMLEPRNPNDVMMAVIHRATFDRTFVGSWKPSIHMPRWASRITLELTEDVRRQPLVEGLTDAEILAEGFNGHQAFEGLWNKMHADSPYESNPLVSVINFTVVHP